MIRDGANNVQIADARSNVRQLFESAYRRAASKYAPGVRPSQSKKTGAELMEAILSENAIA